MPLANPYANPRHENIRDPLSRLRKNYPSPGIQT